MYNVLILQGKGIHNSADSVSVETFTTIEDANAFCSAETNMESKYWTHCAIIESGERVDTSPERFWYGR